MPESDHVPISVVIPALNEEQTVAGVVREMARHPRVDDIVVVDNASTDQTARNAQKAGARVVREDVRGYGRALKTGFAAAKHDLIFKCCSDLKNPQHQWIDACLDKLAPQTVLVKGAWRSPDDPLPVTRLLVKPALRCHFPSLLRFDMPISGQFLMRRNAFDIEHLADDFALDIDMLLRAEAQGLEMQEVWIGELLHADRSLDAYSEMSFQILSRIIEASSMRISEHIMLVMAHPDDAVIWCGGLLTKYLSCGANVLVISVTGNETTERELHSLGKHFPTVRTKCFRSSEFLGNSLELVERLHVELENFAPGLVVTHHLNDPHEDHRSAAQGLLGALMKLGHAALPNTVLMCSPYFCETPGVPSFHPDIFLDISSERMSKCCLIEEHGSQDPQYWIEMTEKMDGLSGIRAGVHYAEAYETMTYYGTPKAVENVRSPITSGLQSSR